MGYRQLLVPRWLAVNGGTCTQAFTTQANPAPVLGTLQDVITALQAASHAGLAYTSLVPFNNVNEAPETGSYPSVSDRAQIILRSAAGRTGRINIPAPLDACFISGSDRVNFSHALISNLLAAVYANLCDPYGSPWVEAPSGLRYKVEIPQPMTM